VNSHLINHFHAINSCRISLTSHTKIQSQNILDGKKIQSFHNSDYKITENIINDSCKLKRDLLKRIKFYLQKSLIYKDGCVIPNTKSKLKIKIFHSKFIIIKILL